MIGALVDAVNTLMTVIGYLVVTLIVVLPVALWVDDRRFKRDERRRREADADGRTALVLDFALREQERQLLEEDEVW